jgi:hypothetical protein
MINSPEVCFDITRQSWWLGTARTTAWWRRRSWRAARRGWQLGQGCAGAGKELATDDAMTTKTPPWYLSSAVARTTGAPPSDRRSVACSARVRRGHDDARHRGGSERIGAIWPRGGWIGVHTKFKLFLRKHCQTLKPPRFFSEPPNEAASENKLRTSGSC